MSQSLEAGIWDGRYENGEYDGEPPIPFVQTIFSELGEDGPKKLGLYVGCGNGRNYIPLVQSGFRLQGVDISAVAIEQLVERYPEANGLVREASFDAITVAGIYDYLVAIQVFQHGNRSDVDKNFQQARDVLKPGGKLFLRVNSPSTEIVIKHHQVESNESGGFTIVYDESKKKGGTRHFFGRQELEQIAQANGFDIMKPLQEVIEPRETPEAGTWSQWESVWSKK